MKITPRKNSGFTLIEVVFAMMVAGISIGAILSGITFGMFQMRLNRDQLRATQILTEKFETLRLYSWQQINEPGFFPTNFFAYQDPEDPVNRGTRYMGTITITPVGAAGVPQVDPPVSTASYAVDMRQVTIKLEWRTGGDGLLRTREWTSFVARNGLQNYIY